MIEKPTMTGVNLEVRHRSLFFFKDPRLYGFLDFCQDINLLSTVQEIASLTAFYTKTFLDVPFCQVFVKNKEEFDFVDGYPTAMHSSKEFTSLLNGLRSNTEFNEVIVNQSTFQMNITLSKGTLPELTKYFGNVDDLQIIPMSVFGKVLGVLVFGTVEKPGNRSEIGQQLGYALMVAIQAANAFNRVRLNSQVETDQIQTVLALAKTIEMRDKYLAGHSEKIADLSERIAKEMGCTKKEILTIRWAALLHDIGKIGIPDRILQKPGSLSTVEWDAIRKHPELGAEIVIKASNLYEVADLIKYHHEKFNGSGYPEGKKGKDIPIGARILAVTDAFSAITEERVYHSSKTQEEALDEIKACSGKDFDPQVVEELLRII
jgi:putative nucleotidyltransferase with HDIG domain